MGFRIRQTEPGDVNYQEFSHTLDHRESGQVLSGYRRNDGSVVNAYGVQNTPEEVKMVFEMFFDGQLPELENQQGRNIWGEYIA